MINKTYQGGVYFCLAIIITVSQQIYEKEKRGLIKYIIKNKKKTIKLVDFLRRVATPPSALTRECLNENTHEVSLKKEYNITKNEKSFYFLTKGDQLCGQHHQQPK